MKKILRLIPALVGISLFILSCGKEQPEQPKDIKVTDITLDSESLSLVEGDSQTLTATISPSNATNKKIVWSSSDASVASVDNGKVTAIKEGEAIIIATSEDGGKTATCKVTVGKKEIPVTEITLDNTSLNLIVGDETTLIATILPEDATNKKVIWSSSDAQIVSVDEGKVKAIKEGEVTITATSEDGGKTATCTVKVTKPKDAYICFSVVNENESNALSITNLNAILQYSYDSIAWHYCEEGQEIPFGNGKQVFVRGLHNGDGNGPIGNFKLKDYTAVSCSGDIMYLLEYESHGTAIELTPAGERPRRPSAIQA